MNTELSNQISCYAKTRLRPDESSFSGLDLRDALKIASKLKIDLYEVEKEALRQDILPSRYSRNQRVLTMEDQQKLHAAQVAVVGLGGLGGGVTELLARIGVSNLVLIDGDIFDETNLNRQLLSSVSNLGIAKSVVAGNRVKDINPAARVRSEQFFLDADNGMKLLQDADIVIDCLDTIGARFDLADHAAKLSIPMVSAAIGGKSGQAAVIYPGEKTLERLYGSPEKAPSRGVEAGLGTLAFTAQYMGAIEVAEAVAIILGKPSTLRKSLLFIDLSDYSMERIEGM